MSQDRWITRHATGSWMVQIKQNVGVNDEGYTDLVDRRQVLPHACIGKWKEGTITSVYTPRHSC